MRRAPSPPESKATFTSLIDIAFLVLIFFMALPLRRLDGKLEAHLPTTEGPRQLRTEPPPTVEIRLRERGGEIAYALGQHEADSPAGLERVLRALGSGNVYEIHASPAVAWEHVVAMTDLLAGLEYRDVRFTGTRPPGAEVRRAIPLPRPE